MIVEFSVKNFRSIKELQTISFVATGLKSSDEFSDIDTNNIAEEGGMRLLKTIGVYGANASGKSNIIMALEYFLQVIKSEPSSESNLSFLCDPFIYQENAYETESFFQIVFVIENIKYRYGFTVKISSARQEFVDDDLSHEIIASEWLFGTKKKNLTELFTRSGNEVKPNKLLSKEIIPALPYEHTLYLNHSAAYDSKSHSAAIKKFIKGWTRSNFSEGMKPFRRHSLQLLEKENKKNDFLELLSSFDLKYDDIIIDRDSTDDKVTNVSQDKIIMVKHYIKKDNTELVINLNLEYCESEGTKKLFDLAGLLLISFNLSVAPFIIIDEIDSNFHPSLLIKLIGLFNNPKINKSNAQLLFTSHDTNLMSPSVMRRDQFYFTEKNEDESTRLYSLSDLKGIRNDADFAKQYLAGFYGALPVLEDYSNENTLPND